MVRSKEHSEAFRKRVVDAYESGKGYRKISKQFEISHSTVRKIVYKWRTFKTTANMPRSGRPRKFSQRADLKMLKEVSYNSNMSSQDLQDVFNSPDAQEEAPPEANCKQKRSPKQENPESTQIKEGHKGLWTNQEEELNRGVEPDIIEFIIPPSCVKSECDQDPVDSLPQTQSVENRESDSKPGNLTPFDTVTQLEVLYFPREPPDNLTNALSHSSAISREPIGLDSHPPCNHRHKLIHTGQKRFSCGDCGKCFNHRYSLKRHELTHTGEKLFSCADCGKSFNRRQTLERHKLTHSGKKLLSCADCGKSFSEMAALAQYKLTDTGEKLYSCGDCGKSFSQKGALAQYKLTDTGEKQFSCGGCGKSFSNRRNLKQHELTHTGEKPFSCSDCGNCFSQRGTLTKHRLTHTGEKTFSCGDCGKSFMYRHHLKQHELTHTGEKPFSCGDCGKSFMYRQHLKQHKLTHK